MVVEFAPNHGVDTYIRMYSAEVWDTDTVQGKERKKETGRIRKTRNLEQNNWSYRGSNLGQVDSLLPTAPNHRDFHGWNNSELLARPYSELTTVNGDTPKFLHFAMPRTPPSMVRCDTRNTTPKNFAPE